VGGITNNVNKFAPMLFMRINPYYYSLSAQEQTGLASCGNVESFSEFTPSSTNDCFLVNDVQSNCTKIWVKINAHFFLEDDCSGTLDPSGADPATIEDAY